MSGIIGFCGPPDRELLDRMARRLSHRGNLDENLIETEFATIAVLEWPQHLSVGQIQTGTFKSPSFSWALAGYSFTTPDPEKFRWQDLRGGHACAAIVDNGLQIFRDSVGCQSLYYGRIGDRWLFASEPKAFTREQDFDVKIRTAAIAKYLACSFVPGRHTMLESVFEAEAGHTVHLEFGKKPSSDRIFRFEEQEWQGDLSRDLTAREERDWTDQTRTCIEKAVAERLVEEEPIVFLSGGLDSSIVAAELARQCSKPIRTFAIHFGPQYANELTFARAVAERIGSRHEEVLLKPQEFLPRLEKMVWHLDEPIGDPITQPNFELASRVQKYGQFVFNGEGGDPLFGGPKNLPMLLGHWYGGVSRTRYFREHAYLASYRRAYEDWRQLLSSEVQEQIDPARDLEKPFSPFFQSESKSFLNKLMAINIRMKGANLILPKVDRMMAAHGLTPASPLFDDRLTLLSFAMPPRMKLRNGIEKYVLKQAYKDLLPQEIIDRPKSGMRVPVYYWFQKEMRRYARRILSKRNLTRSRIFNADRVQQLLRYASDDGLGRYGLRLWMLLTFEVWRQQVVNREEF